MEPAPGTDADEADKEITSMKTDTDPKGSVFSKLTLNSPKQKKKVRKHVGVRYESTDKSIATVSAKGVVKAKKKGTCYIYAYAQNGIYKKIKVVVK